jgi:acyl-CoA thioester hydrolase
MNSPFRIEFQVRDYELDMQGIVNNGVYFNYLEHARHEYLLAKGVDFAALTRDGIHLRRMARKVSRSGFPGPAPTK